MTNLLSIKESYTLIYKMEKVSRQPYFKTSFTSVKVG